MLDTARDSLRTAARAAVRSGPVSSGRPARASASSQTPSSSTHGSPSSWKDSLGRAGIAGRGVLYGIVALLAVQLALGRPTADASSKGAMSWIAVQPFGRVLLVVLTGALFALAVWRFLDAAVGDPVEGDDTTDRIRFAAKGAVYLALAVSAFNVTRTSWGASSGGSGSGSGGDGGAQRRATAVVLGWPAGQWIVAAAGLGLVAYAVFMFKHHAIDRSFMKRLSGAGSTVETLGRAGYAARAVVWAGAGVLLVQAAITYDPNRAGGISASLHQLASSAGGPVLLGLVALGLLAFGVFCVAESRVRRAA